MECVKPELRSQLKVELSDGKRRNKAELRNYIAADELSGEMTDY